MVVAIPLTALYFLVRIDAFAAMTQPNIGLNIDWSSVVDWQWYGLWVLTSLYLTIGWVGFYILRRPFANFARGELFNSANSRDLQRFSVLLFAQALTKPICFALASLLLSANHGPGTKMFAISVGSNELSMIAVAIVFWVVSNLLIEGGKLQSENQQFV